MQVMAHNRNFAVSAAASQNIKWTEKFHEQGKENLMARLSVYIALKLMDRTQC